MPLLLANRIGLTSGQTFLIYCFLFLSGSMLGYGIEVLFRRLFTAHKWVNPGFLKGPWLPMYGFGLILMFTYAALLYAFLPFGSKLYNPQGDLFGYTEVVHANVYDLLPIAIMGLSLIVLEIIAGLVFVQGFHVKLWDYSNLRGNIGGITAPLFDVIWFAVAILYYYFVNPYVYEVVLLSSDFFFGLDGGRRPNFVSLFFLGVVYGLLLWDFITSIGAFGKISAWAKKNRMVVHYEKMREEQKSRLSLRRKEFLASIPQPKRDPEKEKKWVEREENARTKFLSFFLIDPRSTHKASDNYGSDNRPIRSEAPKEDSSSSGKEG